MPHAHLHNLPAPATVDHHPGSKSVPAHITAFTKQSLLPVSAQQAFAWHARPGAFERLSPPWQRVDVISKQGTIHDGDRLTMRMKIGPFSKQWIAEHRNYVQGLQFRDVQIAGPFAKWEHTHRFESIDAQASRLVDHIEYQLPLGALGRLLGAGHAARTLQSVFAYRHRLTQHDLAMHAKYAGKTRLNVAITGATGMIGSALAALLTTGGHQVIRLVRGDKPAQQDEAKWDATTGLLEPEKLEGIDAVIHLAGENVAGGRWTDARKRRILESRSMATRVLCESLARLKNPPRTLISGSAIGYYGDGGERQLDETSASGSGFLAQVCREWEASTKPAELAGIRVVHARIGIVLSPRGGALAKMLTPFKLGMGGPIGNGRQFMSWISLDDAVSAMHHLLMHEEITGPVNLVAPNAVTNREFGKAVGRVLHRPAFAPLPAFIARLAFGQMADEILLAGARVMPSRLLDSQFAFRDPTLEESLRWCLGRMKSPENSLVSA